MEHVILVIHFIVTIGLIGLVLLQRSEGGGLGIGGGGGGLGSLAGAHTTANLLTKTTAIFAVLFFITNLSLAYMAKIHTQPSSVIEAISAEGAAPKAPVAETDAVKSEATDTKEEKGAPAAPVAE
ncbi:MAG: preprotein translocase subunit SecG [Pseudobdellovibrionaceae bacterium]